MSKSSADRTDRTGRLQRGFKIGTFGAALLAIVSYFLPWVEIVGPTGSADQERISLEELATGANDGSIGATEIELFPELIVVLAIIAAGLAMLRWNRPVQAMTGLLGLLATGAGVFMISFLDADSEEVIKVGTRAGLPESFEPAVGLWLALGSAVCIAVFGLTAVVHATLADG